MRRKILTLFLEELLVLENGRQGNADAENILLVSLIWPRPMIDLRTAAKSLRVEDGRKIPFASFPFHEKILFKEIVGGPVGVTLEVTERKSPGVIAQFLAAIASDIVKAAFPLPPTSETFRRIVHAGAVGLGDRARTSTKETLLRIAFGHAVLDTQTAAAGRLELPLAVPETIGKSGRRPPLLTKGQSNGRAVLKYTIEED